MTSKELIEEYINECCTDGWVEYEGKYWKPELEIIHKDLEVLDILKSKAEIIAENDKVSLKINYINLFKDEFDKIMEWLKNE